MEEAVELSFRNDDDVIVKKKNGNCKDDCQNCMQCKGNNKCNKCCRATLCKNIYTKIISGLFFTLLFSYMIVAIVAYNELQELQNSKFKMLEFNVEEVPCSSKDVIKFNIIGSVDSVCSYDIELTDVHIEWKSNISSSIKLGDIHVIPTFNESDIEGKQTLTEGKQFIHMKGTLKLNDDNDSKNLTSWILSEMIKTKELSFDLRIVTSIKTGAFIFPVTVDVDQNFPIKMNNQSQLGEYQDKKEPILNYVNIQELTTQMQIDAYVSNKDYLYVGTDWTFFRTLPKKDSKTVNYLKVSANLPKLQIGALYDNFYIGDVELDEIDFKDEYSINANVTTNIHKLELLGIYNPKLRAMQKLVKDSIVDRKNVTVQVVGLNHKHITGNNPVLGDTCYIQHLLDIMPITDIQVNAKEKNESEQDLSYDIKNISLAAIVQEDLGEQAALEEQVTVEVGILTSIKLPYNVGGKIPPLFLALASSTNRELVDISIGKIDLKEPSLDKEVLLKIELTLGYENETDLFSRINYILGDVELLAHTKESGNMLSSILRYYELEVESSSNNVTTPEGSFEIETQSSPELFNGSLIVNFDRLDLGVDVSIPGFVLQMTSDNGAGYKSAAKLTIPGLEFKQGDNQGQENWEITFGINNLEADTLGELVANIIDDQLVKLGLQSTGEGIDIDIDLEFTRTDLISTFEEQTNTNITDKDFNETARQFLDHVKVTVVNLESLNETKNTNFMDAFTTGINLDMQFWLSVIARFQLPAMQFILAKNTSEPLAYLNLYPVEVHTNSSSNLIFDMDLDILNLRDMIDIVPNNYFHARLNPGSSPLTRCLSHIHFDEIYNFTQSEEGESFDIGSLALEIDDKNDRLHLIANWSYPVGFDTEFISLHLGDIDSVLRVYESTEASGVVLKHAMTLNSSSFTLGNDFSMGVELLYNDKGSIDGYLNPGDDGETLGNLMLDFVDGNNSLIFELVGTTDSLTHTTQTVFASSSVSVKITLDSNEVNQEPSNLDPANNITLNWIDVKGYGDTEGVVEIPCLIPGLFCSYETNQLQLSRGSLTASTTIPPLSHWLDSYDFNLDVSVKIPEFYISVECCTYSPLVVVTIAPLVKGTNTLADIELEVTAHVHIVDLDLLHGFVGDVQNPEYTKEIRVGVNPSTNNVTDFNTFGLLTKMLGTTKEFAYENWINPSKLEASNTTFDYGLQSTTDNSATFWMTVELENPLNYSFNFGQVVVTGEFENEELATVTVDVNIEPGTNIMSAAAEIHGSLVAPSDSDCQALSQPKFCKPNRLISGVISNIGSVVPPVLSGIPVTVGASYSGKSKDSGEVHRLSTQLHLFSKDPDEYYVEKVTDLESSIIQKMEVKTGDSVRQSITQFDVELLLQVEIKNIFEFPLTIIDLACEVYMRDIDGFPEYYWSIPFSPSTYPPDLVFELDTAVYKSVDRVLTPGEIYSFEISIDLDLTREGVFRLIDDVAEQGKLCGSIKNGRVKLSLGNLDPLVYTQTFDIPELEILGNNPCLGDVSCTPNYVVTNGDSSTLSLCTQGGSCVNTGVPVTLTDSDDEVKNMWLKYRMPIVDSWEFAFQFQIEKGCGSLCGNADGISIIVQNSGATAKATHDPGDEPGHGYIGIPSSLGIILDSYAANEITLHYGGTTTVQATGAPDVEWDPFGTPVWVAARVTYDGPNKQLVFSLKEVGNSHWTIELSTIADFEVIIGNLDSIAKDAYIGVGASTGGYHWSHQRFRNWHISTVVSDVAKARVAEHRQTLAEAGVQFTLNLLMFDSCGRPRGYWDDTINEVRLEGVKTSEQYIFSNPDTVVANPGNLGTYIATCTSGVPTADTYEIFLRINSGTSTNIGYIRII